MADCGLTVWCLVPSPSRGLPYDYLPGYRALSLEQTLRGSGGLPPEGYDADGSPGATLWNPGSLPAVPACHRSSLPGAGRAGEPQAPSRPSGAEGGGNRTRGEDEFFNTADQAGGSRKLWEDDGCITSSPSEQQRAEP